MATERQSKKTSQAGGGGEEPPSESSSRAPTRTAPATSTPAATGTTTDTVAVTEKPIYAAPESSTSSYVVTIDDNTGVITKIEKLNEKTGERAEFTTSEYAQATAYLAMSALPSSGLYSLESNPLAQAYYQGVLDYYSSTGAAG